MIKTAVMAARAIEYQNGRVMFPSTATPLVAIKEVSPVVMEGSVRAVSDPPHKSLLRNYLWC